MVLIYLSLAFVAGVYLGSLVAPPLAALAAGVVPLIALPFCRRHWKRLTMLSLCLFALTGGAIRLQASIPRVDQDHVAFYRDQGVVTLTGMVSADPEAGDRTTTLRLSPSELTAGGTARQVSGDVLVRVAVYSDYAYGDVLRLMGKLETPRVEGFDYESYLAGQGIHAVISYPRIEVVQRAQGSAPLQWLHSLRHRLANVLSSALPEPRAALANAVLLGIRSDVPRDFTRALTDTGTAHILAISGMNITMVLGILLALAVAAFGRRRYIHIWLAGLFMWLYVLLTGMQPPVIRAAIMGSMFLLAEFFGRQRAAPTPLAFAAAVMVGMQPQVLWQASFQLSFLAMAGLIVLAPPLQAFGRRHLSRSFGTASIPRAAVFLTDSCAATLGAVAGVFPVIAYYFGIVSLAGIPATLLVVPSLPAIVVSAALAAFLGLLWLPLGWIAGWAAWLFISYLVLIVRAFDALPLTSLHTGPVQPWHLVAYYVLLAGAYRAVRHRQRLAGLLARAGQWTRNTTGRASQSLRSLPLRWVAAPLAAIVALTWSAVLSMPDNLLHVTFLDVGQGDSVLVQTPAHQKILIDGGPGTRDVTLELGRRLPFWDRTIDAVVLTQPQADHLAGLLAVFDRYNVRQAIEPGVPAASGAYREWRKLIADKGIPYSAARAGQRLDLGRGLTLEVLHPPATLLTRTDDDVNNNCLVLRLIWGEVSFLLASDIGQEAESALLAARANLTATVLKVAHHGSRTSTSGSFLARVSPTAAVVSSGLDNQFGHPNPEVVARLRGLVGSEQVYVTAERGAIECITDGRRLWVKTER